MKPSRGGASRNQKSSRDGNRSSRRGSGYDYIVIDRNRDQRPGKTGYLTNGAKTLGLLSVITTVAVSIVVTSRRVGVGVGVGTP